MQTKYNTQVFWGVFISLAIIIVTISVSTSIAHYMAGLFLLALSYLTGQKNAL